MRASPPHPPDLADEALDRLVAALLDGAPPLDIGPIMARLAAGDPAATVVLLDRVGDRIAGIVGDARAVEAALALAARLRLPGASDTLAR